MTFNTSALHAAETELEQSRMALIRIMAKAEAALPDSGYHEAALQAIVELARKALPLGASDVDAV